MNRAKAYLLMEHRIEDGVPVFQRLWISSSPAAMTTIAGRDQVYADLISVEADTYADAERQVVSTARSMWPWARPYLAEEPEAGSRTTP